MIEKIYEECNEHLRETDRKRDQLLVFYTIVLGAYFSSLDKIDPELKPPFAIAVAVFGIAVSITAVLLRSWHLKYGNTAKLLSSGLYKNGSPSFMEEQTKKELENLGMAERQPIWKWIKRYSSGVEFYTMNSFLVITFLPIYAIILEMNPGSLFALNPYLTFLADLLIYLLLANFLSALYLFRALRKSPWADWLLPKTEEAG